MNEDIPDWLQEIITEQKPTEFFQPLVMENITVPVKEPKVKLSLPEPDKTIRSLDRRIQSDGNISETFPQTEVETINERTSACTQKILSKSVQLLAKYRSVVATVGKNS